MDRTASNSFWWGSPAVGRAMLGRAAVGMEQTKTGKMLSNFFIVFFLGNLINPAACQLGCASLYPHRNSISVNSVLLDRGIGTAAVAVYGDDSNDQPASASQRVETVSLATGSFGVCALSAAGSLTCWGPTNCCPTGQWATGFPPGRTWL